jgi:DNA polymerase-3 subunit gamma/tau
MSYQVLARKWRPKTFAGLVGQAHVVKALTHALLENRLHHAYLFTGTRGVGKTTIARILSKSINCESGVTAEPCGVCSTCLEIDAGRFVDLLEVDAATNTRVDEMRQLLENAVYAPTRGRYKVYVIDEVHMLSNSAFNAMLKTLEEPPEHVKFVLATTDPQKIPVTVLSRCLQFNLKQMLPQAIVDHLQHILTAEEVPYEHDALSLLARSANGSMRDALSLLDQAIAHGTGQVETRQVREMLGTVDQDHLFEILNGLVTNDIRSILNVADEMAVRSFSFDSALQELASVLTRIQLNQFAPSQANPSQPADHELLAELSDQLSPEFVQLAYQIVLHGRKDLPLAPDPHAGFVMTLLRLYAFAPAGQGGGLRDAGSAAVQITPGISRKSQPKAVQDKKLELQASRVAADIPDMQTSGDWRVILQSLSLGGMARELAHHCELCSATDDVLALRLSPEHRHLQMKPAVDKLQQSLNDYFGRPIQLKIELAEVQTATPAVAAQIERQERQDKAVGAIEQDGFVREAIELFDATLIQSSIKPV